MKHTFMRAETDPRRCRECGHPVKFEQHKLAMQTKDGLIVAVGDRVRVPHEAGQYRVDALEGPHSPASSGRIYVSPADSTAVKHSGGFRGSRSLFPHVVGCEWVNREDRDEGRPRG